MYTQQGGEGFQPIFAGDLPQLRRQLSFLGEDFNIDNFLENLQEPSIHTEARGIVQSFVPDTEVRIAQRAVSAECSAVLVPDANRSSERAGFEVTVDDVTDTLTESAIIYMSPNAINALYRPVETILGQFSNLAFTDSVIRDFAVESAARGVYANVYSQFLIKRHANVALENRPQNGTLSIPEKIDVIYEHKFGKDGIEDRATRMNRIAMCVGGAAMIKLCVNRLSTLSGNALPLGMKPDVVDKILRLYAKGMVDRAKPRDQQEVTFALVHAFTPEEAAGFMRNWFDKKPKSPTPPPNEVRRLKSVA